MLYKNSGLTPAKAPYVLSESIRQQLANLGPLLWRYQLGLDALYNNSATAPTTEKWPHSWLNAGKPEALLQFARMKRFRHAMPLVLRPDVLVTEHGLKLCELDSVPGGIGFVAALLQHYGQDVTGFLQGFLHSLVALTPQLAQPVIAVVVSDESQDYLAEWQFVAQCLAPIYPQFYVIHPSQLNWQNDRLIFTEQGKTLEIDVIYRFFELFDLPNIPKIELLQYALKKKAVVCCPPFKPWLEEKLGFALYQHPALRMHWTTAMGGAEAYNALRAMLPDTWVLDPTPMPPQGVIDGLEIDQQPVHSFAALKTLSQRQRQLVIKPSGFSPLAWGSRGVVIGHDVAQTQWAQAVEDALLAFPQQPHVLQRFEKPSKAVVDGQAIRTRLCPYYWVKPNPTGEPVITWAGTLATHCPADKKIIHGMSTALMSIIQ